MLTKRTNILFDEQMWKTLVIMAQKRDTSVGRLVRDAVKNYYTQERRLERIKKAVAAIDTFRVRYGTGLAKGEDSVSLIRRMRDE